MNQLSNSEQESVRRYQRWDLILSFLLIAVAVETMPFRASLWLDETLTYWIASGTIEDVWRRAISFQGQSPLYYGMAWSVLKIFPESDLALRFFSICCASGGLFLLHRCISLFVTLPLALSFVVSIAFLSDTFQVLFLSARPYAVAFLCAMASIFTLVTWTRVQKHHLLILYVLMTLLTYYAHYLFLLVVLLHLVIVVTAKLIRPYLLVIPLLAIGAFPGALQLLSLKERAPLLSFAQKPGLMSILQSFSSPALLIVFVVGLLLSFIWGGAINREKLDKRVLCTAILWIVLPVLAFAGVSAIGSTSLFTSRYWSWQVGGIALFCSVVVGALIPLRPQRIVVMLLILGMLFRLSVQTWKPEGWREAAGIVKKETGLPVLLYSGLIEAEDPTFIDRSESQEYLSAPLRRYGVTNPIKSIGLKDEEDFKKSLPSEDFFLVSTIGRRGERVTPDSFINSFELRGRSVAHLSEEGTVTVYRIQSVAEK